MAPDLKAQNMPALVGIYVSAVCVLVGLEYGSNAAVDVSDELVNHAVTLAGIMGLSAIVGNVLPNSIKHRIVYCRVRNVLSGHRCRKICERDARFDEADLQKKWPELFEDDLPSSEANAFWYKNIYWNVRKEPEVVQAHRMFLLCRDAVAGLVLLWCGLLTWTVMAWSTSWNGPTQWSLGLLLVVVLVISQSGRQSGDRMVANAVAVSLIEPPSLTEQELQATELDDAG